ncbi:hypothetical protein PC116_g15676 [Phytophthora cactorum]|uniref:Uncharacterized protein n=1 Tax=Phytophthora cactorum TaxID=29920 RepID=A0A8T1C988_9STRA|nr:hypothetical protein PC114_g12927 [Phytophthora cactorum]KAG2916838.1 hypothetical protein PC117_g17606 [Phytophthora cactorum]KAG3013478.1 hypothetical protein PC119_g12478 [Phytophthora cactorum]KAG3016597.1 hypothetical protein PC120_g11518 [Phytophthora cactorum]KAG3162113.1 hypothetical protein C6341_g13384 [Phytophthora cactorum]
MAIDKAQRSFSVSQLVAKRGNENAATTYRVVPVPVISPMPKTIASRVPHDMATAAGRLSKA